MTAATSATALASIDTTHLEERVLEAIKTFGRTGCISDQLLVTFAKLSYSSVTARYKALEQKGLVVRLGDTRKGVSGRQQQVMRHHEYSDVEVSVDPPPAKKSGFLKGVMFAAKIIMMADPAFKGSPGALALKKEIEKLAKR